MDPKKAAETHLKGVERLLSVKMAKELKGLKPLCRIPEDLNQACGYFGGVSEIRERVLKAVTRRLFRQDIRSREAFSEVQKKVRPELSAAIQDLGARVVEVVRAYHQTRTFLYTTETASTGKTARALCQALREDLADLVPSDFPVRYTRERLGHLPRYLKAMVLRAERGTNDPAKDAKKAEELLEFQEDLKTLKEGLSPDSTTEKRQAVADFRWMVEEFKVSLFAQELKTPYPVSQKRLKRRVQEIQRMI
ncbi:MAG: DUF3418 domain-containing protein [Deltaproteobacteria bacterium]|nr:DUF3418 domain-containing protein [Deltaproteobacteria bacterium]